ncbi:Rib/alpha-like domain-containing protein, partial [Ligilactobacillus apodemi]|uniref:Rib/alpha-like domain-containing protein n=1 Tax=Ligilactobacillus apodemi TaxID=307126 RepID=UPI00192D14FB
MLSKNNHNLRIQKMASKRQRFAIKKFTIGVASVLIGTTFAVYAGSNSVLADQTGNEQPTQSQPQASTTAQAQTATLGEKQATSEPKVTSVAATTVNTPAEQSQQSSAQASQATAAKEVTAPEQKAPVASQSVATTPQTNATATTTPTQAPAVAATSAEVDSQSAPTPVTSSPAPKATVATTPQPTSTAPTPTSAAKQPQAATAQPAQPTVVQPETATPSVTASHVSNMTQFQTALNNKAVSEIVLDQDLKNTTNSDVSVNNSGVARNVTIWGNKTDGQNATLDMGNSSLYFYSTTANTNKKWNLTFKNLHLLTNNYQGHGVVRFQNNGTDATVNFEQVTNDGNGVLAYVPNATVNLTDVTSKATAPVSSAQPTVTANNVNLAGKVDLASSVSNTNTPQNLYVSGVVTAKAGSQVNLTTNNSYGNRFRNLYAGSLNVEKGASLTVNANTTASGVAVPSGGTSGYLVNGSTAVYVNNGTANIAGDLTVNATSKDQTSNGVVAALVLGAPATAAGDLKVSGTLTVNATDSPNTRGVYFINDNHVFGLMKDAKVTLNMGHGVSSAVWDPDNLVLNEGSKLLINTYQDNNGGTNAGISASGAGAHSGVITLNWNSKLSPDNTDLLTGNVHGNLNINKNATLKIVRKMDVRSKQAATPLISYGGTGANNGSTALNVDQGTLDLEDGLQMDSMYGTLDYYYDYLGITDDANSPIYPLGMVAMYGVATVNRVNVVDPKLFKMVRTGRQKGMLFRLEGKDNKITVSATNEKTIPLKYGTVGNIKYSNGNVSQAKNYEWKIKALSSNNWQGDYSMNYNGSKEGTPFGLANLNSVSFAQDTPQAAKDDFNNYFNWWGSSNLVMGTDLIAYHPVYESTAVMQTETKTVVVQYQDKEKPTDVMYSLVDPNKEFSWVTVAPDGTLTVAPTAQTKVGLYNVPVVATFSSGEKKTVYAGIAVVDGTTKVTFNDKGALFAEVSPVVTHKTSGRNIFPTATQVVDSLTTYQRDPRTGDYFKNATYFINAEQDLVNENDGSLLKGAKVSWQDNDLTTVVPTGSDDTSSSEENAVIGVNNENVDFPDLGKFSNLGNMSVPVNVYGATPNNGKAVTQGVYSSIPRASSMVQTTDLTASHNSGFTSITWQKQPSLEEVYPVVVSGSVNINFADGTHLIVPVTLMVNSSLASQYTPKGQLVKTDLNKSPLAEAGIANKSELPKNTAYAWVSPVEVTTPGLKNGTVDVAYPDGSETEVSVQVKVGTDADQYRPQGQLVKTDLG